MGEALTVCQSTSSTLPFGGHIVEVEPGSPAAAIGIRPGDLLISINAHPLHDVLDYQFYAAEEWLVLRVRRGDVEFDVELAGGGQLGLRFADSTFDGIRRCRNRCPFCFVKQLPVGLRRSLYVKDDDFRYSVSYGSFVTLTNITEDDWHRLAEQHLGPLRLSVHATDLALRRRMLGNPSAPDIMLQLHRLKALGLQAHAQLVLCPGLNDGERLARSIADLAALYPTVPSIAAVPVGYTRQNRQPELRAFTREEAQVIVDQVDAWQREYRHRFGVGLVYLGDEFYFLADWPVPSARAYDRYPQYENGVGLVRSLLDEWSRLRRRALPRLSSCLYVTLVCGERIAPLLAEIAAGLTAATGATIAVLPVVNEFFGPSVTVSGLLTGEDVRRAISGHGRGDLVVLPRAMLDAAGGRFLDGMTPQDLEMSLGRPIRFASTVRQLLAHVSTHGDQTLRVC